MVRVYQSASPINYPDWLESEIQAVLAEFIEKKRRFEEYERVKGTTTEECVEGAEKNISVGVTDVGIDSDFEEGTSDDDIHEIEIVYNTEALKYAKDLDDYLDALKDDEVRWGHV